MIDPIKMIDLELSAPIQDIKELNRYRSVQALVRLHGRPLGYIRLPVRQGRCLGVDLIEAVVKTLRDRLDREGFPRRFSYRATSEGWITDKIPTDAANRNDGPLPLVSVAVCTRDRSSHLKACLRSLQNLHYPHLDIMVVDNAPRFNTTKRMVIEEFPNIRYVVEPRPGLDWARNRAIREAKGEIAAFTDDDVVVDPKWIDAMVSVFITDPGVMAVTGLVVPYELQTDAQVLFEAYGGFGKGFERRRYSRLNQKCRLRWPHLAAGDLGTGANMAFRRSVFSEIGGFDPALDVGTETYGGGDLEMMFRVIQECYILVYEPEATVRHIHRQEYRELKAQIRSWGTAFVAYLVRSAIAYPQARWMIMCFVLRWFIGRHLIRMLTHLKGKNRIPLDLMLAEFQGAISGLFAYQRSRRMTEKIKRDFGPIK